MKKCARFSLSIFLLVASAVPAVALNGADVRGSVVKVYVVKSEPDYFSPWDRYFPGQAAGSGYIIEGNRILTSAHVVSDQTFIQVRLNGQAEKHVAEVFAVSHEADLALLTVKSPSFFEGVTPLPFRELPEVKDEVLIYGFAGGEGALSTTQGVVSGIEQQTYVHSNVGLLTIKLNGAIRPGNSGGPALVGDRVIGVAMQAQRDGDLGHIVPTPVVRQFLTDVEDGRYDGIPALGIGWQSIENDGLKKMCGLKGHQSGVIIASVVPGMPADRHILERDVVLSIEGKPVGFDGTVELRAQERTSLGHIIQQHQIGDEIRVGIMREGEERLMEITLDKTLNSGRLVPTGPYDVGPTYYVYGGLVFSPLTMNYLKAWGSEWYQDAPERLLSLRHDYRTSEGEQVVVLDHVLPSEVNVGYHNVADRRIIEVDDQKVNNFGDLVRLVESGADKPFVVFEDDQGAIIVLDREKAELENAKILEAYRIPADRSEDLR